MFFFRRLVFGVCALVAVGVVRAGDVFIAAADCADHHFTEVEGAPKLVSGDRVLKLWEERDPPAEGYVARFKFPVDKPGAYHVWAGVSLPGDTSNFWWNMDGDPWKHVTVEEVEDPPDYGPAGVMGWQQLGLMALSAGEHQLSFRVNERRPVDEHAYLLYLDALLVTDRAVKPSGRLSREDLPGLAPLLAPPPPVARGGKPGPRMALSTSLGGEAQNHIVHRLGFTRAQTDSDHLSANESEPGIWKWEFDGDRDSCLQAKLDWQYFPHYHWGAEWYRQQDRFVPLTGLRTGRKLACISLWSPDLPRWLTENYDALAAHYANAAPPPALYLGVYGDYGEPIFPMGWNEQEKQAFGETGTGRPDFWCGDPYAKRDFQRYALEKYRSLRAVNAAWRTAFAAEADVDYPPAAFDADAKIVLPQERRRWLDFIEWYDQGMTRLAERVCQLARQRFGKSQLALPIGGGSEDLFFGQDVTALVKVAVRWHVQVRSTHGGYKPFAENYPRMIKRVSTACRFYHAEQCLEPPGRLGADREVSRVMEDLSCGAAEHWDWAYNVLEQRSVYQEYAAFFTCESPRVEAALFFPTTSHRLQRKENYPQVMASVGERLRDVMDYDVVDEPLIADGALDGFNVLIWPEGAVLEAATLDRMARWVESGGVIVKAGGGPIEDVEGARTAGDHLLGLTADSSLVAQGAADAKLLEPAFLGHLAKLGAVGVSAVARGLPPTDRALVSTALGSGAWVRELGRGAVIVWAGPATQADQAPFCELARDALYGRSKLAARFGDAPEVDSAADGVYTTLLSSGEALLYNSTSEPRSVMVGKNKVALPPNSIRSILAQ